MKIRMVAHGFIDKYTGVFGDVEFVDGVSVGDVSESHARFLASITSIEEVGGGDPGDNAQYQINLNTPAVSVNYPTLAEIQAQASASTPTVDAVEVSTTEGYTREQLEAIADKSGLAGLRVISDPLNVKSTSISKLIQAILQVQANGGAPKAAEAVVEPVAQEV